jgi:uncharacterized protein (TIGR02611 family)
MERVRRQKERHRRRSRLYRTTFATAGFGVITLGLVLVPLPGPGWLIVGVGLGMLALEFDRAERLLDRILERIERVTEEAADASWLVKVLCAIGLMAGASLFLAAALVWDLPLVPL